MSNSTLVNAKRLLNKNFSSRQGNTIKKIAIHHSAGRTTMDGFSNAFNNRGSSATYVIDVNGNIGQFVDEAYRPWTTSSWECDKQAVTIEVANSTLEPEWRVSDKNLAVLIDLVTDICKRNGITNCTYTGNKNGVLQMHKWYASTACPGPYLAAKFSYISTEVNKRLEKSTSSASTSTTTSKLIKVQSGAFKEKMNAETLKNTLKAKGFEAVVVQDGSLYKVQVGAFTNQTNAENQVKKLKEAGFDAILVGATSSTTSTTSKPAVQTTTNSIKKGDLVWVKKGAKDYNGKSLANIVYQRQYTLKELKGDRAVVTWYGTVVCAVHLSDLYRK